MDRFRGVPQKWKEEGIFVHNRETVCIGDTVEAIRTVQGIIQKGTRLKIADLLVFPNWNDRGFKKRLKFNGIDGEFNPQRFRKVV